VTTYDVAPLQAGWYYDWNIGPNPAHPARLAYAHLLRVPIKDMAAVRIAVAQATQADPGALWLIGNEPDVATMDNVLPVVYAESYHRLYHLIKAYDPTAIVAAGGIVQPSVLRLCYLNLVLHSYLQRYGEPLPADAWHVHNYVLNEQRGGLPGIPTGLYARYGTMPGLNKHDSLAIFGAQVIAMREWMAQNGYQGLPLVISEYGILYPQQFGYDYYRVRNFLNAAFDYLLAASDPTLGYEPDDGQLVQMWNWYSLDDTNYANSGLTWGALFDPNSRRRLPMGDAWVSYVTQKGLAAPFSRADIASLWLAPSAGTGLGALGSASQSVFYGEAAPVTVRASVVNRGTAAMSDTLEVAIYGGEAGGDQALLEQPLRLVL
jgi:hypothetical protein